MRYINHTFYLLYVTYLLFRQTAKCAALKKNFSDYVKHHCARVDPDMSQRGLWWGGARLSWQTKPGRTTTSDCRPSGGGGAQYCRCYTGIVVIDHDANETRHQQ